MVEFSQAIENFERIRIDLVAGNRVIGTWDDERFNQWRDYTVGERFNLSLLSSSDQGQDPQSMAHQATRRVPSGLAQG